ncbi:unnamed protein product [Linum tenue]|uniref:Uncharacterized protein n=1 Tax=Linum tenue TaxID=586396 RepID=A0AAV0IPK1_9ROSI|nr:unnamed protein product [Linum tenue]
MQHSDYVPGGNYIKWWLKLIRNPGGVSDE